MSLLDSFLMTFKTEGLKEIPEDAQEAEKATDDFGEAAEEAEEKIDDLNKTITKNYSKLKTLASQTIKTIAPFVALGKAIHGAMEFAAQASDIADAAQKAGMTIEQFQLQEGNKYAIFTREDVIHAKDYELVMRDIRMGTASIGANISRMLLPALISLNKIVRDIVDFFVGHSTLIQVLAGLTAIGGGIFAVAKIIQFVATPAVKQLGKALWTSLAPIIGPILVITAILAGLALIIEDLIVWINGGESAFGDLWDEIFGGVEGAKALFNDLIGVFKELWEVAQPILKAIGDLILKGIYYTLRGVVKVLAAVVKGIKALTGKSANVDVNENVNTEGSHAGGLDYVPHDGYIAELHKGERVQTASEANNWRDSLMAAKKAVAFTSNYPLNSIPTGIISNAYSNSNANQNINIGDITINTQATDAQGISFDLAKYIKQAMISLDDGMLA